MPEAMNGIEIEGTVYRRHRDISQAEHGLLVSADADEKIRCHKCHGDTFRLNYGHYKIIATCVGCGNAETAYDG